VVRESCRIYQERRDVLVAGLRGLGYRVTPPKATFYVWMAVEDSMAFSQRLLSVAGIVATPGIGFGDCGKRYIRFAITRSVDRIREAVDRIGRLPP
jgi:LL-diaminopimelate aminotransferase